MPSAIWTATRLQFTRKSLNNEINQAPHGPASARLVLVSRNGGTLHRCSRAKTCSRGAKDDLRGQARCGLYRAHGRPVEGIRRASAGEGSGGLSEPTADRPRAHTRPPVQVRAGTVARRHHKYIRVRTGKCDMAERQGFEPWIPCGIHAFQACAFSHSAISPHLQLFTRNDSREGDTLRRFPDEPLC